jgi:hypothetical protein
MNENQLNIDMLLCSKQGCNREADKDVEHCDQCMEDQGYWRCDNPICGNQWVMTEHDRCDAERCYGHNSESVDSKTICVGVYRKESKQDRGDYGDRYQECWEDFGEIDETGNSCMTRIE